MLFLMLHFALQAQENNINYQYGMSAVASTGTFSPFLLHTNTFGTVSVQPYSAIVFAGIEKTSDQSKKSFDYGFKIATQLGLDGQNTELFFRDLYADARLWCFNLTVGVKQQSFGNQDKDLSGGGFLFSDNARPLPRITIGIDKYTVVPYTFGFFEIKGGLSQGWFANNIYINNELLHHKFGYGRLGGKLPVHLEYGLEHVAQWGGTVQSTGQYLGGFKDYLNVFLARSGGSDVPLTDQINVIGNHLIEQAVKLEVEIAFFKLNAYWQNVMEDSPFRIIGNTMNVKDGLWGATLENSKFPILKKILYEYLNTTDQSGPYHDKDGIIYGGSDNYFVNSLFLNSWNYSMRTIGTPYISSPVYNTNGQIYTQNNRVSVHHFGLMGSYRELFNYKLLASFSRNYGMYSNSFAYMKPQASFYLDVNHTLKKYSDFVVGLSLGVDKGEMYGNSAGLLISIKKTGELFKY